VRISLSGLERTERNTGDCGCGISADPATESLMQRALALQKEYRFR
jgi:hypothetical protein